MSTCKIVVGHSLTRDQLLEPFVKTIQPAVEGSFHMEPRWDPKTGKQLDDEKVWDVKPSPETITTYQIDKQVFNLKKDSYHKSETFNYWHIQKALTQYLGYPVTSLFSKPIVYCLTTSNNEFDFDIGVLSVTILVPPTQEALYTGVSEMTAKLREIYGNLIKEPQIFAIQD